MTSLSLIPPDRSVLGEVLVEEGDDNGLLFQLARLSPYGWIGPRRFDLSRYEEVSANALVLWTDKTRSFARASSAFVATCLQRPFLILAHTEGVIDAPLDEARRLEWTNAADIYWQWRVAKGMPEHLINRPKH